MHKLRLLGIGAALCLPLAPAAQFGFGMAAAQAQDALRPAVGNPLSKAKAYIGQRNYAAAMGQVNIAAHQKGLTANENFVILQMKASVAQLSGDTATASGIYSDLISSGRITGPALTQMLLAQASIAYGQQKYKDAVDWSARYYKSGGHDPAMEVIVIQSYYLQNDFANAAKAQQAQINETLKARKLPTESQLQLLAACQKQTQDSAGLSATMTMLLTYYPKPAYWADLVYALQTKPGLSDRLELDLDLFKVRLGVLTSENDYMEMAQIALGDDNPGVAQSVIADAQAKKIFGGASAGREQRLATLVNSTAADVKSKLDANLAALRSSPATTSDQLFSLGQNYASFKQYDQGVGLMQEAIDKGDLRRQAQAQLRVAEAWVNDGDKAKAVAAFKLVPDTDDGTSDLAHLWLLWLKSQPTVAPLP